MEDPQSVQETIDDISGEDKKMCDLPLENEQEPAIAVPTKGLNETGSDVNTETKEGEANADDVVREAEEGSMCRALSELFGGRRGSKGPFDGRQGLAFNYLPGSRYYGMYINEGNEFVANFVDNARREGWDWPRSFEAVTEIAETNQKYAEICDTMVREIIYDAIGATGEFYI